MEGAGFFVLGGNSDRGYADFRESHNLGSWLNREHVASRCRMPGNAPAINLQPIALKKCRSVIPRPLLSLAAERGEKQGATQRVDPG